MKIGIISMQRVVNYGSFLQAYGLKKTIESLGHDVVFIDYRSDPPVVPYRISSRIMYLMRQNALFSQLEDRIRFYGKFPYKYRRVYLPILGVSYRRNPHERVDIAVIGSDEVFNCLQSGANVGFSPMLFGQNIRADKVISYAASCGGTNLERLAEYGVLERVGGYLKSLAAISVRDENSRQVVRALTGREPSVNLDPVLISDYGLPDIKPIGKNYVILYTYPKRPYSEEEKELIKSFCRQNGKILVSIGYAQDWVEHQIDADPFELLKYFQLADFIITDTFHGSVFSIKYNKNFAVFVRPDNRQKLGDLLKRLKMESRQITDFSQLQTIYDSKPDYTAANAVILRERERSQRYLKENLDL